jgi:hypothetical protein
MFTSTAGILRLGFLVLVGGVLIIGGPVDRTTRAPATHPPAPWASRR